MSTERERYALPDYIGDVMRLLSTVQGQLEAVCEVVRQARLISPSRSMTVYVADLERALGIDAPVPHKLGGNDA